MPDILQRLRRTHPYLTPGFFPDDEDGQSAQWPRDMFDRFRLPRVPLPIEDDVEAIPAMRRPPLTAAPPEQVPALSRTQKPDDPKFQEWYQQRAKQLGLNPNPDDPLHQYDYRKAFAAGVEPDASGHWPSQFKMLGHPNRYVDGIDTISGVPVLKRPPLADIDRIFELGDPNPNPLPTSQADIPLLSRPIDMPQPRSRPTVIYDQGGRPTPIVFGGTDDPEERLGVRRRALESYQPQKESKKHLLLRTLLNFPRGGLIGEGGVADTLLGRGGVMDRRGVDEAWKRKELGQVDEQWGRLRTDRRAGLQDRLLESQVRENEAEALNKSRVPAIKDLEVGGRLLRPNASGGYDEVYAPPVKPGTERRPLLRTVTAQDGSTRTSKSDDNGKTWQNVPELQGAPKPDEKEGERRIQSEIAKSAAKAARTKAASLRSNASILENNAQHVDVIEAEKLRAEAQQYRRQAYDADQEAEEQEGRARAYSPPPVLTRGNSSNVTEQAIRDAAKAKNLDPDQAVKRARSRGMIR